MRIFLSHASEDKKDAEAIAFSLRSRGHQVFLDRDDLPPGDSYDHRIERAVRSSDLFLFLLSPAAVAEGRYTLTELSYARRRWPTPAGRVLPVVVKKTPMESIPTYLKAVTLLEPLGSVTAETCAAIDDMGSGERARKVALRFGLVGVLTGAVASFFPYELDSIFGLSGKFVKPDVGLPIALAFAALLWSYGYVTSWRQVAIAGVSALLASFLAFVVVHGGISPSSGSASGSLISIPAELLPESSQSKDVARLQQVVSGINVIYNFGFGLLLFGGTAALWAASQIFVLSRLCSASIDFWSLMVAVFYCVVGIVGTAALLQIAGQQQISILKSSTVNGLQLWSASWLMLLFAGWVGAAFASVGHWLARKAD